MFDLLIKVDLIDQKLQLIPANLKYQKSTSPLQNMQLMFLEKLI